MYKLRELARADIPEINRWRNDPDLIDCLGAPFRYINLDVDEKWYDTYLANRRNTVRCSILNENDQLIGLISLVSIDEVHRSAEIHIMIGEKDNRNAGAGTYAVCTMLDHAFRNLNLHRIELSVLSSNKRAIRFYEKLGFVREGTKRKARFKNGDYQDLLIYALLREEYDSAPAQ